MLRSVRDATDRIDGDSPAEMPVGGYKHSGIGRENGVDSIRHYTQIKSVYASLEGLDNPFA